MYNDQGPGRSTLALGVMFGLLLIALALLVQRCGEPPSASLRDQFRPGPTEPGGSSGISLPAPVRSAAETTQALLAGGEDAPAMTPVAQSGALEVEITALSAVDGGIRVAGTILNVGDQPIVVPLTAFRFRDQSGRIYAAQGDAQATLQSGQSESFDLTLPTENPQDLVLMLDLPESNVQIEMVLLAGGATPTP